MTTDATRGTSGASLGAHHPGLRVLVVASLAGLVVVASTTLVAGWWHGGDAAAAAGVGGGVALAVFGVGTLVVHLVSGLLPQMSLLVALLTYTLQLLVMALVVTGLADTSIADTATSRGWFVAAVIAVTLGWLITQVWQATRLRIPAFEGGAR